MRIQPEGQIHIGNHGSFPLLMYFTSGHTCTVCTLRTLCMFYLIKMKMWYHPQELLWPLSICRFIHHLTSILQSFLERWHPLNQHVKTSFPRSSLWPSRTWKSLRTAAAGTTRIPVEKSRRRPLFDFLWDVFRLDHWMECCKNSVLFFMVSPGWDNVSVPCAKCLVSETLQWNLTIRKLNRWYLEPPGTF